MRFAFLCIFLCLASISHGQSKDKPLQQFEYGVKAGANFSTFHVADGKIYNYDSKASAGRTSFHIGAFVSFTVSEKSKLFGELVYIKKGAVIKKTFEPYSWVVSTKYKVDYLSIPLLLCYRIHNKVSVEFGPQISFLIAQNGKKQLDNRDYSVVAGAKYIVTPRLGFNARYEYGLTNINKNADYDRIGKWYNRTIQVGFSYTFGSAD